MTFSHGILTEFKIDTNCIMDRVLTGWSEWFRQTNTVNAHVQYYVIYDILYHGYETWLLWTGTHCLGQGSFNHGSLCTL